MDMAGGHTSIWPSLTQLDVRGKTSLRMFQITVLPIVNQLRQVHMFYFLV
jgi:hypothetical protein